MKYIAVTYHSKEDEPGKSWAVLLACAKTGNLVTCGPAPCEQKIVEALKELDPNAPIIRYDLSKADFNELTKSWSFNSFRSEEVQRFIDDIWSVNR